MFLIGAIRAQAACINFAFLQDSGGDSFLFTFHFFAVQVQ